MSDVGKTSERLVAQRVRNRIMEEIWDLSRGDLGVHEAGPSEWFETFFDLFPYEGDHHSYLIRQAMPRHS